MKLLAFALILLAPTANADDRHVEGGDILYTGRASGETDEALFRAEQQAVRALIVECGIPHRETIVWKKGFEGGEAVVQVGLAFEACREGREAKGEKRKHLTNQQLVEDQKRYSKMLERDLGIQDPAPVIVQAPESPINDVELDSLKLRVAALERAPAQAPEDIPRRYPTPAQPASACRAMYASLMAQAQQAALSNTPPGNMAQGMAATLFGQASSLNCQ